MSSYFPGKRGYCRCGWQIEKFRWGEIKSHDCAVDFNGWLKLREGGEPDWLNNDKQYWKGVFKEIHEKGVGQLYNGDGQMSYNTYETIERLKSRRNWKREEHAQRHLDSPERQYGEIVGGIISASMSAAMRGKSCIDNHRWAKIGNSADMRRYRRAKDKGCCGFYDDKIFIPFVGSFLIGFNYGH